MFIVSPLIPPVWRTLRTEQFIVAVDKVILSSRYPIYFFAL